MIKRALALQQKLTGESFFGTVRRYSIFVFGGFMGWLILIGLHTWVKNSFAINPVLSYGFGVFFADVFTFAYHRLVTFRIKTNWHVRFLQFTVLVLSISIANWALSAVGRGVLDLPIRDSVMSFLITGFLSAVNFMVNRAVIFRHH